MEFRRVLFRSLVEIEQEARQQDGELSIVGSGIVELPVRGSRD